MGQEIECRMRYRGQALDGKAYLETDYLLFRGDERLKVGFGSLTGVSASAGVLKLEFDGGPAEFELGKAAEKWADKILHPPSRLDKLGVKRGLRVRLVGDFDATFQTELEQSGAALARPRAKADLTFFAATQTRDLDRIKGLGADALWIVYPKGVTAIREIAVIEAGRAAGLKDVKVARFSDTHTALKFIAPASGMDPRRRPRLSS